MVFIMPWAATQIFVQIAVIVAFRKLQHLPTPASVLPVGNAGGGRTWASSQS